MGVFSEIAMEQQNSIWIFTVWIVTGLKSSAWMGLVKSPGSAFGTLSSRAGIPPLNGI